METQEAYCATHLRALESEVFLAVGDVPLSRVLGLPPERATRWTESLPDLLSTTFDGSHYRLREVKYKLEERIVRKAARQLQAGVHWLERAIPGAKMDRAEIVVPLRKRKLKPVEVGFLGETVGNSRFRLTIGNEPIVLAIGEALLPVTVLLL